jgi:hypothetical protein
MVKHSITEQATKENKNSEGEENEKPKAILMAEDLKNNNNKPSLHRKAIWPFDSLYYEIRDYILPGYNQRRSKRLAIGSAKYVSETTSIPE